MRFTDEREIVMVIYIDFKKAWFGKYLENRSLNGSYKWH